MLLLVVELLVSLLLLQQRNKIKTMKVFIFERSKRVLAKVAITGGGRCNVTNSFNEISSLTTAYPRGHKLLKLYLTYSTILLVINGLKNME